MAANQRPNPPAVSGWPILGNVCDISVNSLLPDLARLKREHGDVYMLSLLGKKILVVNSATAIMDACLDQGDDFGSRPELPSYILRKALYDGNDVTSLPYGEAWAALRNTLERNMNDHTGERMDDLFRQEMLEMMSLFKERKGEAFDPLPDMMYVMNAVFVKMISGKYMEKHSKIEAAVTELGDSFSKCVSLNFGLNLTICPFLRYLPVESTRTLRQAQASQEASVGAMLEEARHNFDPDKPPRGFADKVLKLQKEHADDPEKVDLTEENVKGTVLDLFFGGVLTITSPVKSLMLVCIKHPSVLNKIHAEIHDVIGEDEAPSLRHKADMPYVSAVVLEILRFVTPVNMTPRATIKDTTVNGFHVPRGTMVILDVLDANHDETDWPAPWEFKPERFLDDGKLVPEDHPARKRLMFFGAGCRKCPSAIFAPETIFLFIATIWQKFSFSAQSEDEIPSCDPRDFPPFPAVHPKDVKLRLDWRKS